MPRRGSGGVAAVLGALVAEFVDHGISGAKDRTWRPQCDIIAVWPVDCLERSLRPAASFLDEIHGKRDDLCPRRQRIDTTTSAGKALFQMCSVFAGFGRAIIQGCVKAGPARAKAQGNTLGRPRISAAIESKVMRLKQGTGHNQDREGTGHRRGHGTADREGRVGRFPPARSSSKP